MTDQKENLCPIHISEANNIDLKRKKMEPNSQIITLKQISKWREELGNNSYKILLLGRNSHFPGQLRTCQPNAAWLSTTDMGLLVLINIQIKQMHSVKRGESSYKDDKLQSHTFGKTGCANHFQQKNPRAGLVLSQRDYQPEQDFSWVQFEGQREIWGYPDFI